MPDDHYAPVVLVFAAMALIFAVMIVAQADINRDDIGAQVHAARSAQK